VAMPRARTIWLLSFGGLAAACPGVITAPDLPEGLKLPDSEGSITASTVAELVNAITNAQGAVSINLDGDEVYDLSTQTTTTALLPLISNKVVTVYSKKGSVLSAGGAGRIFRVENGGKLLLDGVTLTGGKTTDGGGCAYLADASSYLVVRNSKFISCAVESASIDDAEGGCIDAKAGSLVVTDSHLSNCAVSNTLGNARGGGVGVTYPADVWMLHTRIEDTYAISTSTTNGFGYGGGVSVGGGFVGLTLKMQNVSLVRTHARSTRPSNNLASYGGGVGMRAGDAFIHSCTFEETQVYSSESQAIGGGFGMSGGNAFICDTTFKNTAANSGVANAGGGGISNFGGQLNLYGVKMINPTTNAATAQALISYPMDTRAASLRIEHEPCATGEAAMVGVVDPQPDGTVRGGALLLRNLTFAAVGCDPFFGEGSLTQETTLVVNCSKTTACGPRAVCSEIASSGEPSVLSMACACSANTIASDAVSNAAVAPYTSHGCVASPPADPYVYTTSGAPLMIIAAIVTFGGMAHMIYVHNTAK